MLRITNRVIVVVAFAAALVGCSEGGTGKSGEKAPTVVGGVVEPMRFTDRIEAVGTAYAKESTVLTSTVTERVASLNFNDGEFVKKGDVIARLVVSEQSADLAGAEARTQEAQQQLKRLRELQDRGFATNARVDEQIALLNQARAQAGAVRAQIGDRIIRAPFSGIVGLRHISTGAVLTAGAPIATVSDISTIKLDFTLPETFLSAIAIGDDIEAHAAAWPDAVFRGKIEGIDPVIDPVTRSVTVRAMLPNPERRLRPGMLLTVDIVSNPRKSLAVPELALVAQRDQQYVFRLDEKNVANRVPIEIGARRDGMVEVRSGLSRGDRIVADGTVKVRDDATVRPVFPHGGPNGIAGGGEGAAQ